MTTQGNRRSAQAFKQALDAQIAKQAREQQIDANTIRLRVLVQRFLTRLFHQNHTAWLLKGGFAMELRYGNRARATRDVDLMLGTTPLSTASIEETLQGLLQADLGEDMGDHLSFRIARKQAELTAPPGGGGRFHCQVLLLGKECGKFAVDVACGDAVDEPCDELEVIPIIGLSEFAIATARIISAYQQFAEKIHAYTLPWDDRENTRTKDLVDLMLLLPDVQQDLNRLRLALRRTFQVRARHPLPERLPTPPATWQADFRHLAQQVALPTTDYMEAFRLMELFWESEACGTE